MGKEPESADSLVSAPAKAADGSRTRPPCLWEQAGFFSRVCFTWPYSVLARGAEVAKGGRPLDESDLPLPSQTEEAAGLGARLEASWERECAAKSNPSVLRAIWRAFGLSWLQIVHIELLEVGGFVAQAIFIQMLMNALELSPEEKDGFASGDFWPLSRRQWQAFGAAALFSAGTLVVALVHAWYFLWAYHEAVKIRIAAQTLLFKACMDVDLPSLSTFGTGRVVNIFSSELWRIEMGSVFYAFILLGPPLLMIIVYLAWSLMGVSALCGLLVLVLMIPGQRILASFFVRVRRRTVALADRRVLLQKEMLNHARTIKMQAWEEALSATVQSVRGQEVKSLRRAAAIKATNYSMSFVASVIAAAVTALVHNKRGYELRANELFPLMGLYFPAQLVVTMFFPQAVECLSDLSVMDKRMSKLLVMAGHTRKVMRSLTVDAASLGDVRLEAQDHAGTYSRRNQRATGEEAAVDCQGLCFSWDKETPGAPKTLDSIDMRVAPGELRVLSGRVGSGKSTLMQAVLGELLPGAGKVSLRAGSIAYVGQEPFVMHATVLRNIVIGPSSELADMVKVRDAVWASGFQADLARMPNGLEEQIGERGLNLSGGQKARLALARALYADTADVVVLDDPLSALDSAVQRHVFREAIVGRFLKRGCAVLLGTHQLHLLADPSLAPYMQKSRVSIMDGGRILKDGSLEDLCGDLGLELNAPGDDAIDSLQMPDPRNLQAAAEAASTDAAGAEDNAAAKKDPNAFALVKQEGRALGDIDWKTLRRYFCVGLGGCGPATMLALGFVAAQLCQMSIMLFLGEWANQDADEQDNQFWAVCTGILVGAAWLMTWSRNLISFGVILAASQAAHNAGFAAVMRSSMQFFEANPVGRVLNRFSKDIGLLDDMLPFVATDMFQTAFYCFAITVLVCIVNPAVIVIVLPLSVVFKRLRRFYLGTSMQLKRLEGTTRSPVFAHLTTLLDGLPTVRAFGLRQPVLDEYCKAMDLNFSALFAFKAAERWFGLRLDLIVFVFSTFAVFGAAALRGILDPHLVGLSLAYAIQLAGMFQWSVRQTAEFQNFMTSAERVLEYSDLEPEEPLGKIDPVDPQWPVKAPLEFDNVVMFYAMAPPSAPAALKGVSFTVPAGTSCGIVGRTGAGKSSLLMALLRLNPIKSGCVRIDGVDAATLPVRRLRDAVGVIPQAPTIFTGSVAYNLDPMGVVSGDPAARERLWKVLEEVQLDGVIRALPAGLDSELGEEANALSSGERQCLCLARAVLRNRKLLVLDEATANCDSKTDAQVQKALRSRLGEATVLAIAHRLGTVMDMNNILVMNFGEVAQFGPPHELLADEAGIFADIAGKAGIVIQAGAASPGASLQATGAIMEI
eukprot:TRINITY_DN30397_c0_g1_i1.p1 TRINITY_DN30397_c0_g1~~TRINITY_DN30397_c0_g1_i1.p1  ORF type:complete len:1363 (-),score=333.00 TRINITY_DN30397_c0_g1_i1:482-4570(-)